MGEQPDYVTVEEMASMHGTTVHTIHRILWADQDKPPSERRIPGAKKVGSRYRGEWRIPLESARQFKPRRRGRPKMGA